MFHLLTEMMFQVTEIFFHYSIIVNNAEIDNFIPESLIVYVELTTKHVAIKANQAQAQPPPHLPQVFKLIEI